MITCTDVNMKALCRDVDTDTIGFRPSLPLFPVWSSLWGPYVTAHFLMCCCWRSPRSSLVPVGSINNVQMCVH